MDIKNFDKLVNVITANVLQKIDPKTGSKIHDKACLIILSNMCFGIEGYLEYIMDKFPGYELYLGANDNCSKLHYIETHTNINFIKFDLENSEFLHLLDEVETIIILGLSINQMKALTKTDDSEDVNHLILGRLMANKSVSIMMNANGSMYNKIADIVDDIKNMGINVTNIQKSIVSTQEKVDLITESYVVNLKENGIKNLVLDKKQLITPLAKDKLREFKIEIKYNEEEKK